MERGADPPGAEASWKRSSSSKASGCNSLGGEVPSSATGYNLEGGWTSASGYIIEGELPSSSSCAGWNSTRRRCSKKVERHAR